MGTYLLRRVLIGALTLWGISVLVFVLIRMMPGDPAAVAQQGVEDPKAAQALAERIRAQYHLDDPLPVQYGKWLADVAVGDFGASYQDGRPVVGKIRDRLPATVSLAALSILLGLTAGIPLGVIQAVKQKVMRVKWAARSPAFPAKPTWSKLSEVIPRNGSRSHCTPTQ